MKKKNSLFLSGLLVSVLVAGLSFTACKKEAIKAPESLTQRDATPNRLPVANGTITMSGSCGHQISCGSLGIYGPKYNQLTFAKDATTILVFPNLRYSIFKYTSGPVGGISTYTKIDEFICNNNTVIYSTPLLENLTSHYLIVTDPSTPAPPATGTQNASGYFSLGTAFPFTTLNLKGGSCVPK